MTWVYGPPPANFGRCRCQLIYEAKKTNVWLISTLTLKHHKLSSEENANTLMQKLKLKVLVKWRVTL